MISSILLFFLGVFLQLTDRLRSLNGTLLIAYLSLTVNTPTHLVLNSGLVLFVFEKTTRSSAVEGINQCARRSVLIPWPY